MKEILGINYYFSSEDYCDKIFSHLRRGEPVAEFVQSFKHWIESRYDVEVHTLDCVSPAAPEVRAVLYFDYSWRYARHDKYLETIPFQKRALMMIEPQNINPSLYYTSFYRKRFGTVFTWDKKLLQRNPHYKPVNVPVGAEPSTYRENHFRDVTFDSKRMLVAISRNRWSYMPQSTYGIRKKAYAYFEEHFPDHFDLYGQSWNSPVIFYEKWFGFPKFKCFKGEVPGGWDDKVRLMANYKFAFCFENNANQPGYISEKITDCFCARCVPIYYGSDGVEELIPRTCWIDARQFKHYGDMADFLFQMSKEQYAQYIDAIENFMRSSTLEFFSTEHYFRTLAEGLGLQRKKAIGG